MIAAQQTELPSVSTLLGADHARVDGLLEDLAEMLADGEVERAEYHFADVEDALKRHIRVEEEILFPVFDARVRLVGPTSVMRVEHRRIEALLGALRAALDRAQVDVARQTLAALDAVLVEHDRKEERILYPKTDAALAPDELVALVARIASARRGDSR
jgi:iron-sulfur cluster repair protein YtfE (RIC family)